MGRDNLLTEAFAAFPRRKDCRCGNRGICFVYDGEGVEMDAVCGKCIADFTRERKDLQGYLKEELI